jgi:hypothetical protein
MKCSLGCSNVGSRIQLKYSGRESNFERFVVISSVPTTEISITYTFLKIIYIIEILIIGGVNCLQLEQQPVHVEFYNVLKKTSCQLSLSVFVVGYIRSY